MPWKEVSIMSQRLEFVTLATAENANIRHLCRCFGISSATAYKWLHRFQSDGGERSGGPFATTAPFTVADPGRDGRDSHQSAR